MKLSTVEKFLLIAHHPNKGRFVVSEMNINYGIIGAILLEMSLEDKVIVENDNLILKNSRSAGNQIVSEISIMISSSNKPRKIKYWITKLASRSGKYKWIILNELSGKNFIRIENKTFLGFIRYKRSYLIDGRARDKLIQQLRSNILFRQEKSNESVVLLGLIEACKMHPIIASNKGELKVIRKKLKQIIKESPIADTVDKTIKQVQAAIFGAIIASIAASSAGRAH